MQLITVEVLVVLDRHLCIGEETEENGKEVNENLISMKGNSGILQKNEGKRCQKRDLLFKHFHLLIALPCFSKPRCP